MRIKTLLAPLTITALASTAAPAFAVQGLNESVWHNIPYYDYSPTAGDITSEQNWAAANSPAYTFLNSVDGFNYGGNAPSVAAWFGADAAGAALSDSNGVYYVAFDARGYIHASVAGSYTFSLGNYFNYTDDAARVTIDGKIVAQQNFYANLTPYATTLTLSAGYHSFDLFYFQTFGGYNLNLLATGPNGAAINFTTTAVPEPSTWALLLLGFAGLGFARYRVSRKCAQSLA